MERSFGWSFLLLEAQEGRNLLLESYSDDDFDPTKMENLVLLRQTPLIKVLLRCFENSKLFTECAHITSGFHPGQGNFYI